MYHLGNARRPPAVVDKKIIKQKKLITGLVCLLSFLCRSLKLAGPLSVLESFHFQLCVRILPLIQRQRLMSSRSILSKVKCKIHWHRPEKAFLCALSGEKFVRSLIQHSWK